MGRGGIARLIGPALGFVWLVAIFFCAALLLFGPLFGRSWEIFIDRVGEPVLLRICLGFLFLVVGIDLLRRRAEAALRPRAAVSPQERRRQAIDILLRSLDSDREEIRTQALRYLRQLTGTDQGEDPDAWRTWWRENRSTFRFPASREAGKRASSEDA
ncbi:MAG: hypothetical protein JXP34_15340 [Planctomycetes bacterium]|nr:hypothetical protein [Planctomycetota bacterium]